MIYIELFGIRMNLYAQIAGLIGLVLIVCSYQLRKTAFLALSGVAFVFFLAESCLLYADSDTFTGIVLNAAALVRNAIMFLFAVRFHRETPVWVAVCLLVPVWVLCAFHLGAWYTWLPPVLQTVYTFLALPRNYYCLKAGAFIIESGNLFYNAAVGAYAGVVRQVVLVVCVVVSTAVLFVRGRRARRAAAKPLCNAEEPCGAEKFPDAEEPCGGAHTSQ